jgi:hypothetical protein
MPLCTSNFIVPVLLIYVEIFFSLAEILSTDVSQIDEVLPDAGLPVLALQVV